MTIEEKLILELLKEKRHYKEKAHQYYDILNDIISNLYSIGAPLNDNVLNFNKKQLIWLMRIGKLVKYLNNPEEGLK